MKTALAISPHLDDAIFSAGGTLSRLAQEGWRVVIATVFTASMPDPTGFALACQLDKGVAADIDYMALRREEDAAACRIVGAEPIWMPYEEAPHRSYDSAAALFGDRHAHDDVVNRIAPAIADLVSRLNPDTLMAPQAVGAHVDHVAVYQAVHRCAVPVSFWVDFPYVSRPRHRPSPFCTDIAALPQEKARLSPDDLSRKSRAVSAYASQLGFQFGGADKVEAAMASHGAEERFALRR